MKPKSIFESKTAWFNAVITVLSVLAMVQPETVREFMKAIPYADVADNLATIVIAIIGLINIWLRTRTNQPVKMSV